MAKDEQIPDAASTATASPTPVPPEVTTVFPGATDSEPIDYMGTPVERPYSEAITDKHRAVLAESNIIV